MNGSAVMSARGVTVVAGGKKILDVDELRVERAAMMAVVGPNGSGKTTLLRALAGIGKVDGGVVELMGDDIRRLPRRDVARRLSYVPQNTWTEFDITVRDAVAMGRFAHRPAWKGMSTADVEAVERALERTDLGEFASRTLPGLSGGERQRVFLARALAQEAHVLVLDEPTSSLDPRHELELLEILTQLHHEGRTVVCAIHDLQVVWRNFPTTVVLGSGKVAVAGPTREVLADSRTADVFGIDVDARDGELRCTSRSSRTTRA